LLSPAICPSDGIVTLAGFATKLRQFRSVVL
jgi:hypothetical protein